MALASTSGKSSAVNAMADNTITTVQIYSNASLLILVEDSLG